MIISNARVYIGVVCCIVANNAMLREHNLQREAKETAVLARLSLPAIQVRIMPDEVSPATELARREAEGRWGLELLERAITDANEREEATEPVVAEK